MITLSTRVINRIRQIFVGEVLLLCSKAADALLHLIFPQSESERERAAESLFANEGHREKGTVIVTTPATVTLPDGSVRNKSVGVVSLRGVIVPRSMKGALLPLVDLEGVIGDIEALSSNPDVDEIVLDIDSPGGLAAGVPEAAAKIRKLSPSKPIVAFIDSLSASAAYYLASAASKIVAKRSSEVGSVGAIMMKVDVTKALDNSGIDVRLITTGEAKGDHSVFRENTESVLNRLQHEVDNIGGMFLHDVVKYRGLSEDVAKEIRSAKLYSAREALELGMIDEVVEDVGVYDYISRVYDGNKAVVDSGKEVQMSATEVMQLREDVVTTTLQQPEVSVEVSITPPADTNAYHETCQGDIVRVNDEVSVDEVEALLRERDQLRAELTELRVTILLERYSSRIGSDALRSAVERVARMDLQLAEELLMALPVANVGGVPHNPRVAVPREAGLTITPPWMR
jgi:signal peptide peptidase SppA